MHRPVAGFVLALLAPGLIAVTSASASTTPRALLSASLKAAKSQHSVRYVSDLVGRNPMDGRAEHVTIVGDAAVSRGIQRIKYREGSSAGAVTVIVVSGRAYIRGDAFTLEKYMGFAPATAIADAGRWLLIPPSDSYFSTVAAGVRLNSAIDGLRFPSIAARVPTTVVGGTRVVGVKGFKSSYGKRYAETLYVRAAGLPLPVAEIGHSGGDRVTVNLGHWNERVAASAPANARPISWSRPSLPA